MIKAMKAWAYRNRSGSFSSPFLIKERLGSLYEAVIIIADIDFDALVERVTELARDCEYDKYGEMTRASPAEIAAQVKKEILGETR